MVEHSSDWLMEVYFASPVALDWVDLVWAIVAKISNLKPLINLKNVNDSLRTNELLVVKID